MMRKSSRTNAENAHSVVVQPSRNTVTNGSIGVGQKRFIGSSPNKEVSNAKRSALGVITNNVVDKGAIGIKPAVKQENVSHRPVTRSMSDPKNSLKKPHFAEQDRGKENSLLAVASITPLQQSLEAARIHDVSASGGDQGPAQPPVQAWVNIDEAERENPLYSWEYAIDVYQHMRSREEHFRLPPNILSRQLDVSQQMRRILVDWLVELQENFELYHETLYLTVKLVDRYLTKQEVKREYLQLIGATAMLIASKFEELSPPLVDDFVYLCDDAYTALELKRSEREMLKVIGYDINIPIAYRFLRRFAKAANASFETHTLARFICESSLQVYEFVSEKASLIAAAAMYLALRMRDLGGWTATLQHYSLLSVQDLLPMAVRLNRMLSTPWRSHHTVRTKYSHGVFHKVAEISPLKDVEEDAKLLSQS